jgi:hypothetical protein
MLGSIFFITVSDCEPPMKTTRSSCYWICFHEEIVKKGRLDLDPYASAVQFRVFKMCRIISSYQCNTSTASQSMYSVRRVKPVLGCTGWSWQLWAWLSSLSSSKQSARHLLHFKPVLLLWHFCKINKYSNWSFLDVCCSIFGCIYFLLLFKSMLGWPVGKSAHLECTCHQLKNFDKRFDSNSKVIVKLRFFRNYPDQNNLFWSC